MRDLFVDNTGQVLSLVHNEVLWIDREQSTNLDILMACGVIRPSVRNLEAVFDWEVSRPVSDEFVHIMI